MRFPAALAGNGAQVDGELARGKETAAPRQQLLQRASDMRRDGQRTSLPVTARFVVRSCAGAAPGSINGLTVITTLTLPTRFGVALNIGGPRAGQQPVTSIGGRTQSDHVAKRAGADNRHRISVLARISIWRGRCVHALH